MFSGLASFVIDTVDVLGPLGILILIALENLFPPLPSELILPLAGFLVAQGRMSFAWATLAATAGSVLGALILYGLGRTLGRNGMDRLARRLDKTLLFEAGDLERAQAWFDRHGGAAVMIGRLVPGLRSIISIPAGIERMPVWKFVIYTAFGSGIWNSVLISLGWGFGAQWQQVGRYMRFIEYGVLVALVSGATWFIWRRLRRRRQ